MEGLRGIRVFVVDDHPVARSGIKRLLSVEEDIEVVGDAGDADDAAGALDRLRPEVVVVDLLASGAVAIEATRAILVHAPEASVLVLSVDDDGYAVRDAFSAGASGYVLKEAVDAELAHAVRAVANGGRYVNPELGGRLAAIDAHPRPAHDSDPLSDREREVFRLLALGHTNTEIAELLSMSVRTAESHRAHIMQKLSLSSRAELVRHALAQGLLDETG